MPSPELRTAADSAGIQRDAVPPATKADKVRLEANGVVAQPFGDADEETADWPQEVSADTSKEEEEAFGGQEAQQHGQDNLQLAEDQGPALVNTLRLSLRPSHSGVSSAKGSSGGGSSRGRPQLLKGFSSGGRSASRLMTQKSMSSLFSAQSFRTTGENYRKVHFQDAGKHHGRELRSSKAQQSWNSTLAVMFQWLETLEMLWNRHGRPLVIFTSLFELWSMGIWLGFLTEPAMATSLFYVVVIDILCNCLYIIDTSFLITQMYLDEVRERRALHADQVKHSGHHARQSVHGSKETIEKKRRRTFGDFSLKTAKGRYQLKVWCGLLLATGMVPVQFLLMGLLQAKRYVIWQVLIVLALRFARVIWAFRDCAKLINQQEIEVYVDIRMHGTSGSSWNRARILSKQFLIVVFFGHWFGCLSYALRNVGGMIQQNLRYDGDTSRDYFDKFEDVGMINFETGESFWHSYLLSVYKGFSLNYEDLLPERPIDLMLEVIGSIMILLMKSYCIGSFFKYHQKRELEVQRFASMMNSVMQYLNLYEVPPSLRKTVVNHFRFQQANHRKIKTLEVISKLPAEIQKKLREFEVLPIVVDRNPTLFGQGVATEFCMQVAVMLVSQFLQPGEVIFLESEVPRELIFLDSGAVSFSRRVITDGRATEQLMRYVRADRKDDPTALGAVSLILGCPHFFSVRVRAGTDAVILTAPRDRFDELIQTFPDQHDQLIRNVAEMYHLDQTGKDLATAEKTVETENETFLSMRMDVRLVLQSRQDSMNTAFTYAATNGDVKLVKELLAKSIEPDVSDYDARSALHLAASEGMAEVLETLLEATGNANLKDRWGSTPMQDALKNNFMGAAKLLQKYQGVLELEDPAGELCTYASEGNTIQMQQLLDFGVDPNAGDYDARTALHLSASEGHLPVITFLTSRKANVNVKDRWNSTPMEDAIRNGFGIAASHLRMHGGRVDETFVANLLCDAASQGNLAMLQMLFETGVDVNQGDYDSRTALHLVAAEGQVLALNYLVNTARAMHSPVDRWKATPLQDAFAGGHDLCVQILMSVGADVGPSADDALRARVAKLSADLGFGQKSGIRAFSDTSSKLRSYLGAHMVMVQKGQARGDIFDASEAAKFNQSIIQKSFVRMRDMCALAAWFAELMKTFEAAAEPMWQLQRLIRDADALCREARFWADMHMLDMKRNIRKKASRGKNASKDARDMVFHKAFLGSMRFVPSLVAIIEYVSTRLIQRVETMHAEHLMVESGTDTLKHFQHPTPLSQLVAEELLKELGWIQEEDDDLDRYRTAAGNQDSDITVDKLANMVEGVARVLMPGDHLSLTLFRGALLVQGRGILSAIHEPAKSARGSNLALRPLCSWLETHSRATLSGKDLPMGQPPVLPEGALMHDMYGSLWPIELEPIPPKPVNKLTKSTSHADLRLTPEIATTHLVASQLVLIAVTALVLEGWDRDINMPLQDMDAREAQNWEGRQGPETLSQKVMSRGCTHLSMRDVQQLGRICRETSLVCRGAPPKDSAERKLLKRTKKQQIREEKERARQVQKEYGHHHVEHHDDSDSDSDVDADVEELERLPIRLAKILALQDKMSLDELTVLVDVDDNVSQTAEDAQRKATVFGELSRERFVLNLLRVIINHDELQKDVIDAVRQGEVEQDWELAAACVQATMSSNIDRQHGTILEDHEEEFLYAELTRIQEDFSQGVDSDEVDDMGFGVMENNRMSTGFWFWRNQNDAQAKRPQGIAMGARNSNSLLDEDANVQGKQSGAVARILSACTWICRFCGQDGRKRRKQKRIAKRFRELDDDGEGVGASEMAQLLGVAFNHTLGHEMELRSAYRVFELLNKADVGDLVTLPEMLQVLPQLEEEIKEQQRKNKRGGSMDSSDASSSWAITRFASRLVIPPDSQFLLLWDYVRRWVVIIYFFEVPVRFCYLSRTKVGGWQEQFFLSVSWLCDLYMATNIILNFFRGFVHPTLGVVTGFNEIRTHYVFGLFAWDMIGCCPLDLLLPEENGTTGLLARPRAAMRLLRLLHLRHLKSRRNAKLEASHGFYYAAWSMSLVILGMAHFLACGWWLLGTRYDTFDPDEAFNDTYVFNKFTHVGRGSWSFAYVHRPGEPPVGDWNGSTYFWWQYLVSFYWSLGRITSQSSPGNIFAASWVELAWICALFLLNVAVNGYCDGILVDKVIAGDEAAIEAKAMSKIVDEYLQTADLPPELVKDIHTAAAQSGKVVERQRMESTIAALPHSLKQRLAKRLFVPKFSVEIFQGCSESFLVELGAHCRILEIGKDQNLATKGEPADQLIVLLSGRIAVVNESGLQMAETSTPGEMVGEMPFVFDLKHVITMVTLEESRLMILQKADFKVTCKLYPEDAMSLKRGAMKVIQNLSGETEDKVDKFSASVGKKKAGITKAKSTLSFATTHTASSASSQGSQSTTVSHALRRMYAGDLKNVVEKLRQDQAAARQDLICNFVQQAADGDEARVETILAKGEVQVDEGDYDARTALHLAVCNGHLEVTKCLIEKHDANMGVKDRFGHTPVDDAVRENHVAIVQYLVSSGAKYQADGDVAAQLCQAAYDNNIATMRLLLNDVLVNPNVSDYDKRTPLHLGASEGHLAVVELLAELPSIDLSPRDRLGNTPLDDSMRHKHRGVRKFLHSKGAKMGDQQMGVTLCDAAYRCDLDALRELADSDVPLHEGDYDHRTALHLAASENHLTVATYLLLEAKVDPNPLDRFLSTPLDDAIRHKHNAMEEFIRQCGGYRGQDPNMVDAVANFKESRRLEDEQRLADKLEKEVKSAEVSSVTTKLQSFKDHPTLEDDVHTFVGHAVQYRSLLLRLLRASVQPQDGDHDELDSYSSNRESSKPVEHTKDIREKLLEIIMSEIDEVAGRVLTTFETEVLPWIQGLNKHEERLLHKFLPDMKPAAQRIVDHLKSRARLIRFTHHLWHETGPETGAYHCAPVALMMQRIAEAPMDAVMRARLEAQALIWASGKTGHAQAYATNNEHQAGESKDGSQKNAGAKKTQRKKVKAPDNSPGENPYADTVYESLALRMMLEDETEITPAKDKTFDMEQWQCFKML